MSAEQEQLVWKLSDQLSYWELFLSMWSSAFCPS